MLHIALLGVRFATLIEDPTPEPFMRLHKNPIPSGRNGRAGAKTIVRKSTSSENPQPKALWHYGCSKDPGISLQTSAPNHQKKENDVIRGSTVNLSTLKSRRYKFWGKQKITGHCRTHAHFSENQRWNWWLVESRRMAVLIAKNVD